MIPSLYRGHHMKMLAICSVVVLSIALAACPGFAQSGNTVKKPRATEAAVEHSSTCCPSGDG